MKDSDWARPVVAKRIRSLSAKNSWILERAVVATPNNGLCIFVGNRPSTALRWSSSAPGRETTAIHDFNRPSRCWDRVPYCPSDDPTGQEQSNTIVIIIRIIIIVPLSVSVFLQPWGLLKGAPNLSVAKMRVRGFWVGATELDKADRIEAQQAAQD